MAASGESFGDVLYRSGEDSHSEDIWDDSALIEAYDRAVNMVKNGKNSGGKGKGGSKYRKQQNSKGNMNKRKERQKGTNTPELWKVSDRCCAKYTDDGEIYNATIISIDFENKKCVVSYDDYGNEEEHDLKDLMLSQTNETLPEKGYHTVDSPYQPREQRQADMDWSSTQSPSIQVPTFSDSYWKVSDICLAPECPSGHWHEAVINSFPTRCTCQVTFVRSRRSQQVDRSQLCQPRDQEAQRHTPYRPPVPGHWPPPPPGSQFPSFHPSFPSFPPPSLPSGMMPMFGQMNQHIPAPPIPPVPPHPLTSSSSEDNEALASMLMSWYLSGYYTGYYQGTQRNRQHQNDGCQNQPDTTHTTINSTQPSTSVTQQQTKIIE